MDIQRERERDELRTWRSHTQINRRLLEQIDH